MKLEEFLEKYTTKHFAYDYLCGEQDFFEFEKNPQIDLTTIFILPYIIFDKKGNYTFSVKGYITNDKNNSISISDYCSEDIGENDLHKEPLTYFYKNLSLGDIIGFFKLLLEKYNDDDIMYVCWDESQDICISRMENVEDFENRIRYKYSLLDRELQNDIDLEYPDEEN